MKQAPQSYEYCMLQSRLYVLKAETATDDVRADIDLVNAAKWIRKAREALRARTLANEAVHGS